MKTKLFVSVLSILCLCSYVAVGQNDSTNDGWKYETSTGDTYLPENERVLIGDSVTNHSNPDAQLIVKKNILAGHSVGATAPSSTFSNGHGVVFGDAGYILDNDNANLNVVSRGGHRFYVKDWSSPVQAMTLTQAGLLGLGETGPLSRLHVLEHETGASGIVVEALPGGNPNLMFAVDNGLKTNLRYNANLDGIEFLDYNTQETSFFVSTSGKAAIGDKVVSTDPDYALNVHGKMQSEGIGIFRGSGAMFDMGLVSDTDENTHAYMHVKDSQGKTGHFIWTPNAMMIGVDHVCSSKPLPDLNENIGLYIGDGHRAVKEGSGTWETNSDRRLKQNIAPLKNSSDILRALQLYEFEYNGLGGTAKGNKYTGFIAQELQEVLPNAVGTVNLWLNPEDKQQTELLTVNPNDVWMHNVNATKELIAKVDEQNLTIERLETALEQRDMQLMDMATKQEQLEEKLNSLMQLMQQPLATQVATEMKQSRLYQSVPNPTDGKMMIGYFIAESSKSASLSITNIYGKQIEQFEIEDRGESRMLLDAQQMNLTAGTYIYSLQVDGRLVDSKQFMLLD